MVKNLKLVLFVCLLFFVPSIGRSATLTLSPSSTSVSINGTFTVNILLDTTGQNTYGVDVNRLRFNPSLLQVVDADTFASGIQIGPGSLMSVTTTNNVDNTGGSIQFSQLATPGSTYIGSGILGTITFRAVGAGTANVNFDFSSGSGTDSNVAGLGVDLLTSVGSGIYTLNALDSTAPTISNGTPTGSLVYTTTSTTMGVSTNENATCRFSTFSGSTYSSMVSTFTTTGGTNHSTTFSGLTSGNTYTRYVRCQDTAGNANTVDYIVTFSVASIPDTTAPTISAITSNTITPSGATITWTTNENSDTQIDYGLTSAYGQSSTLNSSLVTSHSVVLTGLSANTTYNYRVRSRDSAGNLATGVNQTFTTSSLADATAPSVPTGLTVTSGSQTQALLTWNASTDVAGPSQTASGVAGYQVWRGGVFVATSSLTSFNNSGLLAGTTYSYQVASFDNAGNISNRTSSVSVTTQSAIPVQRQVVLVLEGTQPTQRSVSATIQYLNPTGLINLGQSFVNTNTSGQVSITLPLGLPSIISIRPIVSGYLARLITNVDTISTSILIATSSSLPAGDFNADQIVNSIDFSMMNTNWLSNSAVSDINKDGIVNSLDFAYLSNNWLQIGQ